MSAPKISAEEFRKRYLASLRLQMNIDAKNLQANQLFKETAQPAQIEDNRSITEKFADIARVSQILIKELSKITDAGSANAIVNSLNDDDKRFLIEQFGAISAEAERRFKFGFTEPIFKPFFQRFKESYLATGGFSATPAEIAGEVVKEEEAQQEKAQTYKKTQGNPNSAGTFTSKATPLGELDAIEEMTNSAFSKLRMPIIKELRRQVLEEDLSVAQVGRRKNLIRELENVGDRKSRQAHIDLFTEKPQLLDQLNDALGGTQGRGIKGRGLKKSKSSPTLTEGMPQTERFAKFGRYMIDKQKLKDGQCVIRFTSGACIHKIPARRIGKEVQNVLTKISGGGLPTYDDINSLTQDDRRYLYNIQKSAKMDAQIPSPDKDAETKEMEEFEKMRGQILAGNDNRDLLKKFKMTLLKFGKDGRIPRREVNEVLLEMASLGM
jgi:hypothetical protein